MAHQKNIEVVEVYLNIYTFTEARQKLSLVLNQAAREGEVRIKRRDGQIFVIRPQGRSGSPLNFKGLDLKLTLAEIMESIQKGRKNF